MLIEDRVILMMIEERVPLYMGEFVAVLELHRFFVKHTLNNLIRKKVIYFNKKKGVYGLL